MERDKKSALRYFAGMLAKNAEHARKYRKLYKTLRAGQQPKVVIAFCADSRLQSCMFGNSLSLINNLFVGRDIGNTYSDSEGAVDYAIRHLGVPVLFIMGHTGCGAALAAHGDYSKETRAIRSRLCKMKIGSNAARGPQKNVDAQVNLAIKKYSAIVTSNKLVVIGGIFDLTGSYGAVHGKIYITNLNGISDLNTIRKQLSAFKVFQKNLLPSTIKRL
ncbi:carbonic anhydrase [Elusimicrobiota bacterium]